MEGGGEGKEEERFLETEQEGSSREKVESQGEEGIRGRKGGNQKGAQKGAGSKGGKNQTRLGGKSYGKGGKEGGKESKARPWDASR